MNIIQVRELRSLKLRLAAIFLLATAALTAAAFFYYRHHCAHLAADAEELLRATAVFKADQILNWRRDRLDRTASLLDSPILSIYLEKLAAGPGDRETAALLKRRLQSFIEHNRFDAAYLTDAAGRIKIGAGGALKELCRPAADLVKSAPARPVMGDLHHSPDGGKHGLHIAALAAKSPSGAGLYLVLTVKPEDYLYPLVQKWPGPSATGETLLLRREGAEVVFLNELRHAADTALKLRLPLKPDLPAAIAATGRTGIVRGTDYRGKKVLAYLSALPEFGWHMVTKVDMEEVLSDAAEIELLLLLGVLLFMGVLGAGAYAVFSAQTLRLSGELDKASAERLRALQDFETVFKTSPTGKSITSIDGTVRPNRALCELIGYSEEELRKKNWREITPKEDIAPTEALLKDLLEGRKDTARFEKRYIRKDGAIIWGDVSTAIHRNEAGKPEYFITSVMDITERKRLEASLREREMIFSKLMEHSPVYVFFKDADLRSLHLSRNFEKMLGRPLPELLGKTMYELFPTDFAKAMVEADRRILEEGKEITVLEEFGGRKYRTIKFPIEMDGKPRYLAGYTIDITDQELAAEALLKEKERAAGYLKMAGVIFVAIEPDGTVSLINDKGCELMGRPREELLGKNWFDFAIPEDKREAVRNVFSALINGQGELPEHYENEVSRPDGTKRVISWHNTVRRKADGTILGTLSSGEDVTDRKLAQEALAASENRFRQLFEAMEEGFATHEIICDERGNPVNYRFLDVNPAFERLTGLKRENLLGRTVLEALPGTERSWIEAYGRVALEGSPLHMENFAKELNKWFEVTAFSPRRGQFAVSFFDITARKRAELEAEKLNKGLVEKNREMENFLYITTHDLRSPLVNIQGFSRNLASYLEDFRSACGRVSGLPEDEHAKIKELFTQKAPEALGFILDSSRKMDALITALLKVSRAGRVEVKAETLDMGGLVRTVLDAMRFQLEEARAEVRLGAMPPCWADRGTISQILSNLLDNAVKYRDKSRPPEIEISGETRGETVVYRIADNGPGIPERELGRIWNVFYSHERSGERKGEGIGLPMVRRLVERNGGGIKAESKESAGTVFHLELPAPGRQNGY